MEASAGWLSSAASLLGLQGIFSLGPRFVRLLCVSVSKFHLIVRPPVVKNKVYRRPPQRPRFSLLTILTSLSPNKDPF